jgi:hypothetical protein
MWTKPYGMQEGFLLDGGRSSCSITAFKTNLGESTLGYGGGGNGSARASMHIVWRLHC